MKKKQLGNTGLWVTEIGFGVLPIGPHQLNLSAVKGAQILKYALSRGINFIDTAEYYKTYPHIRLAFESMQDSNLPLPIISCKSLATSYDDMRTAVKEALRNMSLKQIDIFLLHEVRPGDFAKRRQAWAYLIEAKKTGLIKAIGISTHHVDVALEMINVKDCDVVFPLINYAGLGIRNGETSGIREDMEKAICGLSNAGKGVFTMKVFGGGPLIGQYQKALRYNLSLDGSSSAMVGFGSYKDVDDIFDFIDGKMDKSYTPDTSKKRITIEAGSCEGCGACIKRCPNKAISFSPISGLAEVNHTLCMTCGYCTPVCPVRAIILY